MAENITTILDKAELTDSQASDKFYVMRGTGSDRDRNSTLATILAGAPFSAATRGLRDENAQWKVFTPANGTIDTGTWAQNSIVQMQAWEDTITNVGATIKNAVMILIPRWGTVGTAATATSCTFQHAFPGAPDITITIPAGNIAVISFGSSGGVQEYHCIPSSNTAITAAIFKTLSVGGNATVGETLSVMGALTAASGAFSGTVSGAAGSFSGSVSGATANFSGNVVAQGDVTSHGALTVDGTESVSNISVGLNVGGTLNVAGPVVGTNLYASGNATVNGNFICAQAVTSDTTIEDEATPGARRMVYNVGDSSVYINVYYLASSTDTAGTITQYTLPARSGMEFVYLRSHANSAGTYTCHEWGHVE